VHTPEGIDFVIYPAGLPIRACARAIDWIIQGAVLVALLFAAGIFSWTLGIWFTLILIFILNWFYHTAFEVFWRGQSPGKRIMGIRVVRGDGSPVNPGASFLRNLLRFADTFMFLYLIAFICMLVSHAFRRFGDWAADTLVVYTVYTRSPGRFTSPALRRPNMPWLADIPMVSPSRSLDYEEKQAVLMFARRYPLLGKARADEIARIWTDTLRGQDTNLSANDAGNVPASEASAYLRGIAHSVGGTPNHG
jgi:uncharacterized RDD family membrane protein YckC